MSLRVNDGSAARSHSRPRERSNSRSNVRGSSPMPAAPSLDDNYTSELRYSHVESTSMPGALESPQYEIRRPAAVTPELASTASLSFDRDDNPYDQLRDVNEQSRHARQLSTDIRSPHGIEISLSPTDESQHRTVASNAYPPDNAHGVPQNFVQHYPPSMVSPTTPYPMYDPAMPYHRDGNQKLHTTIPYREYAAPAAYQYQDLPETILYTTKPVFSNPSVPHIQNAAPHSAKSPRDNLPYPYSTQLREVRPREEKFQGPESSKTRTRNSSLNVAESQHKFGQPSTGLSSHRLSVSGNRPELHGLGTGQAPPSPLLEAYHGTYQSMSPMPSPLMLARDLDDLPPLSPLSTNEHDARKRSKSAFKQKKHVKIYDGEADAETLAAAMNHHEARSDPLIDILPEVTHDQLLELRDEYKKRVKVQGRGVNLSKHIKVKTTGNFGKICYVTSLGRWESESYWANFWYQSHSSNRELLIEALMGRSNTDIREIKDSFRDKRYNNSLSKCMEKELKLDKFRMAVLMALEERRQEETDVYPVEYRNRDAEILYRALKNREGGETAIIQIVVTRSDSHLREVVKTYERMYQGNFAQEALKKSNNLVVSVPL